MDPHINSPESELVWNAHPARERLGQAVGVGIVIVLLAGLAGVVGGSSLWGVGAALLLLLALNRYFFPSRFAIDHEGITAHYPLRRQRLEWSDMRRFVLDRNGGFLSRRRKPSWIDAHRGMHLLFGDHREDVVPEIRARIPGEKG